VAQCRAGKGPVIVTANTFRMGGHATHDEAEARQLFPAEVFAAWGRRDPIGTYETWLVESGKAGRDVLARIEDQVVEEVERGAEAALASRRDMTAAESDVVRGLYADDGSAQTSPALIGTR